MSVERDVKVVGAGEEDSKSAPDALAYCGVLYGDTILQAPGIDQRPNGSLRQSTGIFGFHLQQCHGWTRFPVYAFGPWRARCLYLTILI